eukprot:scaffold34917_cov166-Amphora_coffeaeformis.AAC.7
MLWFASSVLCLLALPSSSLFETTTQAQNAADDDLRVTSSRRAFVGKVVANLLIIETTVTDNPPLSFAMAADQESVGTATVILKSPQDRLGVELYETDIGIPSRRVVAIRTNSGASRGLKSGMVLKDYTSLESLKGRLQGGPYPVALGFSSLAAEAYSAGAPRVTAQDALDLARSEPRGEAGQSTSNSRMNGFRIDILDKPICKIQSRRNDVLEIIYVARFGDSSSSVVYDSSERRGTGQPYQMVLGSGDILTGVDLGLYDMCPGERRRITIPPRFGYGAKGNRLHGVPPDQILTWEVELVRINGAVGIEDERSREEMEERVPYSSR